MDEYVKNIDELQAQDLLMSGTADKLLPARVTMQMNSLIEPESVSRLGPVDPDDRDRPLRSVKVLPQASFMRLFSSIAVCHFEALYGCRPLGFEVSAATINRLSSYTSNAAAGGRGGRGFCTAIRRQIPVPHVQLLEIISTRLVRSRFGSARQPFRIRRVRMNAKMWTSLQDGPNAFRSSCLTWLS
ncbi:hypothetical protein ABIB90_008343 [Bradyrhizobium sp. JR4.1]|uniref:hypothetical protein n=1 Tax=Bradyrhizobium sp. JR4.1 TaxID=3156372 RepID=UPI0033996320